MRKEKKFLWLLIALAALILIFFTKTAVRSALDFSRLIAAENLSRTGSFRIINPPVVGDMTFDGHYWYSDKLPLLPLVAGGIHHFLHSVNPQISSPISVQPNSAYYLLTLIFSGLPFLIFIYLFYHCLSFTALNGREKILFTFLSGFATLPLIYATVFTNHVITALFCLVTFYYLLKLRQQKNGRLSALLTGLFSSLVLANDVILGLILIPAVFLYLLNRQDRAYWFFLLGALPVSLFALILNWIITGTIYPPSILIKVYGGLPENSSRGDINFDSPGQILKSFEEVFFGWRRGLVVLTPVFIIAWWQAIRHRGLESLFIVISLIFIITMIAITNDASGVCYGLRWAVPLMPIWFWSAAAAWKNFCSRFRYFFIVLALIGLLTTLSGLAKPFLNPGQNFTLLEVIRSLF